MNVALVVYGSVDRISGGYLYDRKVISALRARGVSVAVVELKRLPYFLCPVQGLTPAVRSLFRRPGRRAGVMSDFPGAAGRGHDVIVVDELVHPSVWPALVGRKSRRSPVVTLVHHLRCRERIPPLGRALARSFERFLLNRSDLIVTTGKTTVESVRPLLNRDVPVVTCMPGRDAHPTRMGQAPRSKRAGEPARILSVGIVIRRKGFHRLVQALSALKELEWECIIAGDDSMDPRYAARLRALVGREGLLPRVRITGRVSDAELAELYGRSHVFAFPSELEGYGIALAEAMGHGLPYVAFAGGALPELTGKGEIAAPGPDGDIVRAEGGLTVGTTRGLARALRALLENEKLRVRLSREARERARRFPTWEQTGRCFYDALKSAAIGNTASESAEGE